MTFTLFLLAVMWCTSFLMTKHYVVRPLAMLIEPATAISEGNLENQVISHLEKIISQDEIGAFAGVFHGIMTYFRNIADMASRISQGHLLQNMRPLSEKDVLGNALQHMTTYLAAMGNTSDQIAEGDFRKRVVPRSFRDQIGIAFVQMQEGLITLISRIRSESEGLNEISSQVLETSARNVEALEHIGYMAETTSAAMRQMNASVKGIRLNMEELSTVVEHTNSSIGQMSSSVRHVAGHSRILSQCADKTIATVLNIVNSLGNIAEQAERSKTLSETTHHDATFGRDAVGHVIRSISSISEVTDQISEIILRLQHRSQEIGTILDVINEVAEQTSLLALNASIIAAQAGVHGRGFAVVADEIKELATRVGTSTQEISRIVGAVQRDSTEAADMIQQGQQKVEHGVVIAHQAGSALKKIGESARNSSQVVTEIAGVVHKQTTTYTDIAKSLQDVSMMIAKITRITREQEQNSSGLLNVAENMQNLGIQVLRATQEQQQSTDYVSNSMDMVLSLVSENSQTGQKLAESAKELTHKSNTLKQQVELFLLPDESSSSEAYY